MTEEAGERRVGQVGAGRTGATNPRVKLRPRLITNLPDRTTIDNISEGGGGEVGCLVGEGLEVFCYHNTQ